MTTTQLVSALAALAFATSASAQEATPAPEPPAPVGIAVQVPAAPSPPTILTPAQAAAWCAPSLVPPGATCKVAGMTSLDEGLVWAFYDLGDNALSVILAPDGASDRLKVAASMPVSSDDLEQWRDATYDPAGVIVRGEARYVGMAIRGYEGLDALGVWRLDPAGLTPIETAGAPAAIKAKIAALSPGCQAVSGGLDWRYFRVLHSVMSDEGSCGTVMIDLKVEGGQVMLGESLALKPALPRPSKSRRRHRRAGPG